MPRILLTYLLISVLYVRHEPGNEDPPPNTRSVRVQEARPLHSRDAADFVRVLHPDIHGTGYDGKQRHCQDRQLAVICDGRSLEV